MFWKSENRVGLFRCGDAPANWPVGRRRWCLLIQRGARRCRANGYRNPNFRELPISGPLCGIGSDDNILEELELPMRLYSDAMIR
jgi:hypothetical protein